MTEEPSDIAELFARDPLHHSDKDIDRIIEELRKGRAQFKTEGKSPAAKAPKAKAEVKKVSLDELF